MMEFCIGLVDLSFGKCTGEMMDEFMVLENCIKPLSPSLSVGLLREAD